MKYSHLNIYTREDKHAHIEKYTFMFWIIPNIGVFCRSFFQVYAKCVHKADGGEK